MAPGTSSRWLPFVLLSSFAFLPSIARADEQNNATIPFDSLLNSRELIIRADEGGQSTTATASNDFTCGPGKPCVNGACCGVDGWCGYEPKYCGDGCQSNCGATAECGTYSNPPGQLCPLNVCCSKYGFCGTTSDFCVTGCQSNCEQPKPSVAKSNVQQKIIAYWEGWNENKACENMTPDEIPVNDISHLVFAFGFITPTDFKVTNMPDVRPELFDQVAYLKNKNPDLVIQIALGGWTHNDPGKYQKVFSDMVSTRANRSKFIKNLLGFLSEYGFDGVDFDWEYPGAEDRGGKEADGVNYTRMLQELRQAIQSAGKQYTVTFTSPTSYWYLRHFDLSNMVQYVDWINLMSYDLHGTWDSSNPIGSQLLGHTNITEIDLALDLFWRNNISPSAIVLGIGFYGRSFKLKNSKCWKPGCAFTGGGDEGECTKTAGFLSYSEIQNILSSTNAKPTYDKEAKVNYLVYGQNNWISFDDKRTFQDKIDFANKRGLNGLMIWAIDLDDSKHTALAALTGNEITDVNDPLALEDLHLVTHSTDDPTQCRVTDCKSTCNPAERAVGRVKSKEGNQCGKNSNEARYICCPAWTSLKPESCYWNNGGGSAGIKTDCSGKCDVGDIKVLGDSWGWEGDLMTGKYGFRCLRGGKIFCCDAGNQKRYLDICFWTKCGDKCPSDKQNVLTWDSGGPSSQGDRCDSQSNSAPLSDEVEAGDASDATKGTDGKRKLCCPKSDSFTGCEWKSSKVCSEQCSDGQITLDLDPQGQGGKYCNNGRQQAFCCNAPGNEKQPFLPVDLDKIFPPDYLPPADAIPQFEIINFGGLAERGEADPDATGVAFFLLAGSSTGLSSMSKRDNPGLHFLDCPVDIENAHIEHRHTVRIICLDSNEDDCFAVTKGGVEGTVVHLPSECGNSTFARAVSLIPSQDQSIPVNIALQNPTSAVYDFTFDYNMNLVRRDAGKYSIRMDYSNVAGYWGAVVNSDGNKKRSVKELVDRFFSNKQDDWSGKFSNLDISNSSKLSDISKSDLKHLLFFDTQMCPTDQGQEGQGIAVAINGTLNIEFFYGFSLIATWDPSGKVEVHQSAGFLHPTGTTSATFTVAGIGSLDTSQKLNGKSITKSSGRKSIGGHSLFKGWASFVPYKEESFRLKTTGEQSQEVSFNGYMEVKTQANWGSKSINFPSEPDGGTPFAVRAERNNNMTPIGETIPESKITVANLVTLGLNVDLAFQKPYQFAVDGQLPDMAVTQILTATFEYKGTGDEVCLTTSVFHDQKAELTSGDYVGWDSTYVRPYFEQGSVGAEECFKAGDSKKKKRQNNSTPKGDYSGFEGMPNLRDLIDKEAMGNIQAPEINCDGCGSCIVTVKTNNICCGCAWLPPDYDEQGSMYLPGSPAIGTMKRTVFDQPMTHRLESRVDKFGINMGEKGITFWDAQPFALNSVDPYRVYSEFYPAFPDYYRNPLSTANWDASPNTIGVKVYFHNTSNACDSFDVTQSATYDWEYPWPKQGFAERGQQAFQYVRGQRYHAQYQTEHVFEGQTIARFFTSWLPYSAATRRQKYWIEVYILSINGQWSNTAGQTEPFISLLVDELGSRDKRDRLTVFMSRSNGMKGSLFTGKTALTPVKFMSYAAGPEQLLAARQIGYIFTYMNTDTVWESFCDTYNGILTHLAAFDTYYLSVTGTSGNLAYEWPLFIRSELDMVVRQARSDLKMMNQRKSLASPLFLLYWSQIMAINGGEIQKVKLARTDKCTNLPASTVGAFIG